MAESKRTVEDEPRAELAAIQAELRQLPLLDWRYFWHWGCCKNRRITVD